MGRPPTPDDLVVPAPTGNNLRDLVVDADLQPDLHGLGLRRNGSAIPTKGTSEPRFWTFSASWREEAHEQRSTLPLYAA